MAPRGDLSRRLIRANHVRGSELEEPASRLTAGGRTLLRFVDGGNGFASRSIRRIHFGLGTAERIDELEVLWPSGRRQTFENLPAGRWVRLVEGEAPRKK